MVRHCAFCGTELPEQAQFCGYCGRLSPLAGTRPQNSAVPSSTWSSQDDPTVISNTSLPTMIHEQFVPHSQQEERTLLTPPNNATWISPLPQPFSDEEEQDRMRRARVWEIPLSAVGAREPSGAPVIQGTPPGNDAPSISGPPSPQMVGRYTSSYQQSSQRPQLERQKGWAQASAVYSSRKSVVTRWMIVVLTAVLVLTTAGVGVALAVSPSLSLEGGLSNSAIVPGHHLSLHGSGFLPGGHITLKRDNDQIVQITTQNSVVVDGKITLSDIAALSALSLPPSADSFVTVNAAGNFNASLLVGNDWGVGEHTLYATEDMFSRSATITVNVDDVPPGLSVSPANLDFGSVQKGTKTSLSLDIGDKGGKPLLWTATKDGAKWLKLQSNSGEVLPNGESQSLAVSCDTTSLTLGTYAAIIHVQTNGGDTDVNVSLHVVAQMQAKLSVSPSTIDFQTMGVGQQAIKVLSISNTGTLKLDWQVTGDENWVSPTPASGFIQPGAAPQRVNVQVDTTGLQPGSYSATLTVGSNGGATQVTLFLVVSTPLPPMPTATPIPPTPTPMQVLPTFTPTRMPQGSICRLPSSLDFGTVLQGQTATKPLTLGNCGDASFTWRAQPGDTWVAINNSGSTLDPTITTMIKVTVNTTAFNAPGTYQSTLIFYTSVGNQMVNITMTVAQMTPTPTSKPTSVPIS